jgi:hypothetical protein
MPLWREILEMRYLWDTPHGLDGRPLSRLLPGFRATPLPTALRASLAEMGIAGNVIPRGVAESTPAVA